MKSYRNLIIVLILTASSYSQVVTSIDERSLKGKIDSANTAPIIVEVTSDEEFRYGGKVIGLTELTTALDSFMDTRMPDERVVSILPTSGVQFSRIVELLKLGRSLEIDDFSFASPNSNRANFDPKSTVPTKIVLGAPEPERPEPGPRFLGVQLTENGSLTLNGKVFTDDSLVAALKKTFATRKRNRVYVSGSRDVNKTVFVRVRLSTGYDALWRVLRVTAATGAFPIALEIDWLAS